MKKKDFYLHELIQHLEPQEKRYISKSFHSKKDGLNDTQLLYDFMLTQTEQNDQEIKVHFQGKKFLGNLDEKKHYLYDTLLKILQDYYYSHNEFENVSIKIDVLISKKLYDHAYIILTNTLKKVETQEVFESQTILLQQLLTLSSFIRKLDKMEIFQKIILLNNKQQRYYKIDLLYHKIMQQLAKVTFVRNVEQDKVIIALKNEVDVAISAEDYSVKSALLLLICKYFIQATYSNWQTAYEHAQNAVELLNRNPAIASHLPLLDLTINSMFINSKIFQGEKREILLQDLEHYRKYIEKFKDSHLINLTQTRLLQYEMIIMHVTHAKMNANEKEKISNFLITNPLQIESFKLKFLQFDFGKLHYFNDDKRSALKWLNKITIPKNDNTNLDIYVYAKIIGFICEIERNETDNIKHNINQFKIFLKKQSFLSEIEEFIIDFIKNQYCDILNYNTAKKREMLLSFLASYQEMLKQEYMKCIWMYFNFEKWVNLRLADLK
jgi:hypothetical protein